MSNPKPSLRLIRTAKTLKGLQTAAFEVFQPSSPSEVKKGASSVGGAATCPITGYTTAVESVRRQLVNRRGGAEDARLLCVIASNSTTSGRSYADSNRQGPGGGPPCNKRTQTPNGRTRWHRIVDARWPTRYSLRGFSNVVLYGMTTWGDLFSPRQAWD